MIMFIDNLYIFALISQSDISNINGLTMILKITAVLNVSTYIITSITACPIRLAVICNIRYNACLDLHNWCYSIYLYISNM